MSKKPVALAESDEPILEKIKHLIPPVSQIAKSLQIEHATAERIYKLMLIRHAGLVDASEQANQNVSDSADTINAQSDLISNQRASMDEMEHFADLQSGAQTIAQNQDVWFRSDVPSIQHVLNIVDLRKLTEAARDRDNVKLSRIAALVDALLSATEGHLPGFGEK